MSDHPSHYFRDVMIRASYRLQIKSIALVLMIILVSTSIYSQVNVKIGYNIGFPQLPVNDDILAQYSPADSEVIDPFSATSFMHGIQLGLRYRVGNIAAEVGWESISRDRTALTYRAANDSFTDRQYNYSLSGLSVGVDNYFGRFGLGSVLLYNKLSIDRTIGNNNLGIVNDRKLALRLQFIWQVQESEMVALQIKPYYQFNLKGYNLSNLANDLDVSGSIDANESPKIFGISLIFYNGKQR